MEEDCLILLALQYRLTGRHDVGRLQRRWKDQSIVKIKKNRASFTQTVLVHDDDVKDETCHNKDI